MCVCVCMYIYLKYMYTYETSWQLIHAGSLWHAGAKTTAGDELIYIVYTYTYIHTYIYIHILCIHMKQAGN